MNKEILDLYTDYLSSSFGQTTATGLSKLTNGEVSHDQVSRMLASPKTTSKDWWRGAPTLVGDNGNGVRGEKKRPFWVGKPDKIGSR